MALSESVENSLNEAQSSLKNALAYAARQEDPYVSVEIAKMIQTLDLIKKYDRVNDKLQDFLRQRGMEGFM